MQNQKFPRFAKKVTTIQSSVTRLLELSPVLEGIDDQKSTEEVLSVCIQNFCSFGRSLTLLKAQ